jgi:hypothetical protein
MATLSQVGIPGVGNGILMPKLKNRWRVTFQGIGAAAAAGNSVDLSMQATTITRPNLTHEQIKIDRYNSSVYIAGKHEWEPCNFVIQDDITGKASIIIQNQLEAQQKLIGADGPWLATAATASAYKFGCKLDLLDGNEQVVEQWLMEGCWIANTDYGDLDYSVSEAVTISLQIRYDHARQVLNQLNLGTAIGGNL